MVIKSEEQNASYSWSQFLKAIRYKIVGMHTLEQIVFHLVENHLLLLWDATSVILSFKHHENEVNRTMNYNQFDGKLLLQKN